MSSVLDPKYLEPLMTVMSADKPNLSKVASAISLAARCQWYCWHVLCPDSPVHDERSMYRHCYHVMSNRLVVWFMERRTRRSILLLRLFLLQEI